jgi:RND family efflux transporter MFP subunit
VTGPAPDLSKLRIDRAAPPPKGSSGRILIIVGVVLATLGGAVFFLRGRSAVTVETIVVAPVASGGTVAAEGSTTVTANGYVVARTRASVSAKVPGRLAWLGVDEGSRVTKGQVIARLEDADFRASVDEAQAAVATAEAMQIEAQADRDQARRESDRTKQIRAENPNLMSAQEAEAAESRAVQAEARASAARSRLNGARASFRFAEASLDNSSIRAPFSGTVLRKEAEVGEVVAPSVGGGLTRGAVVTIADLTTLEVEVDVNEAYIGRVTHRQAARITLDAYPDTSFRGVVRQVVPTADRQRATVQVKVSITDRDSRILPEMGARVDFIAAAPPAPRPDAGVTASAPPRFRLPVAAVRESGGKSVVWLVRGGKLTAREVQAGPASGGFREIRSGLSGGEQVLTGGVEAPTEGMRVEAAGQ